VTLCGENKSGLVFTPRKRTQGAAAVQGASPLDTTVTVSAAGFFAAGFFATPFLLAGLFRRVPPRAWRLRFRGPDSVVSAGSLMPQRSRAARERNPCCADKKLRLCRLRSETYQSKALCVASPGTLVQQGLVVLSQEREAPVVATSFRLRGLGRPELQGSAKDGGARRTTASRPGGQQLAVTATRLLWFAVLGLTGFGFRTQGLGLTVSGLGFGAWGLGFGI
jgi:hypothetical protein